MSDNDNGQPDYPVAKIDIGHYSVEVYGQENDGLDEVMGHAFDAADRAMADIKTLEELDEPDDTDFA